MKTRSGFCRKNGNPAKFGDDFGGDEETIISKEFDRPVLIHHYPSAMKAFYMQPDAQRPELALAFDMIAPEGYGEIIGGSQRIHDYDLLLKRLREHNLPEESFSGIWICDAMAACRIPALEWAWSARSPGFAGRSTSGK